MNLKISPWQEILFGAPQESILGPILFKMSLSEVFPAVNNGNFYSDINDNIIFDIRGGTGKLIF